MMRSLSLLAKKVLVVLLAFLITATLGLSAPKPVHAQGAPVIDVTNLIHNIISGVQLTADHTLKYILNGLAWQLTEVIRQSMVRSVINWINSGFEGSPAFVQDLEENLLHLGDAVANKFLDELANGAVNSPYRDAVADAVRLAHYFNTGAGFYIRNPYTLDQYSANPRAFIDGEFSEGGFTAWYSVISNPQNSPYGAYGLAVGEINNRMIAAKAGRLYELENGNGFLSWRGKCFSPVSGGAAVPLSTEDKCFGKPILTPGSVIHEQLTKHLGSNVDKIVHADELNEIVNALFNQLINKVLGDGGLVGVSSSFGGGGSTGARGSQNAQFLGAIDQELDQLRKYQSGWQSLKTAADSAIRNCPNSQLGASTQAAAAGPLSNAASAISTLTGLRNQSVNADAQTLLTVWDDFQLAQTSSTYPKVSDMANLHLETMSSNPNSTFSRLTTIALTNPKFCTGQ